MESWLLTCGSSIMEVFNGWFHLGYSVVVHPYWRFSMDGALVGDGLGNRGGKLSSCNSPPRVPSLCM